MGSEYSMNIRDKSDSVPEGKRLVGLIIRDTPTIAPNPRPVADNNPSPQAAMTPEPGIASQSRGNEDLSSRYQQPLNTDTSQEQHVQDQPSEQELVNNGSLEVYEIRYATGASSEDAKLFLHLNEWSVDVAISAYQVHELKLKFPNMRLPGPVDRATTLSNQHSTEGTPPSPSSSRPRNILDAATSKAELRQDNPGSAEYRPIGYNVLKRIVRELKSKYGELVGDVKMLKEVNRRLSDDLQELRQHNTQLMNGNLELLKKHNSEILQKQREIKGFRSALEAAEETFKLELEEVRSIAENEATELKKNMRGVLRTLDTETHLFEEEKLDMHKSISKMHEFVARYGELLEAADLKIQRRDRWVASLKYTISYLQAQTVAIEGYKAEKTELIAKTVILQTENAVLETEIRTLKNEIAALNVNILYWITDGRENGNPVLAGLNTQLDMAQQEIERLRLQNHVLDEKADDLVQTVTLSLSRYKSGHDSSRALPENMPGSD